MIDKVLIAEDHQSINLSLERTLEILNITDAKQFSYCDHALKQLVIAQQCGEPYDLLITDLSFDEDDNPQEIKDGWALIAAARQVQPALKVLVFSIKGDATTVDDLFTKYAIDGFVQKSRHDTDELCAAIKCLGRNQPYFPRHLSQRVNEKNAYNFSAEDIMIISFLADGIALNKMPAYMKEKNIIPISLSNIEKRLKRMKDFFDFRQNWELITHCKGKGII